MKPKITQADRDAGADYEQSGNDDGHTFGAIRRGQCDNHPLVQAFARHRTEAFAAGLAEGERLERERGGAAAAIARIASLARDVGIQAGVGGMETAGSFVSFLAANPHYIDAFIGGASAVDWPSPWHANGCLSWHGQDGKLHWPGEREVKQ